MTSIKSCRHAKITKTTGDHIVTLHEIFGRNNSTTTLADRFLDREELSNERISLHFPNGPRLIKNWHSFRSELKAKGLEVTGENGTLVVSGYPPRNDYDARREITETVVRNLCRSLTFP